MADTNLTIQDLQEAVEYWKPLLGLYHWNITPELKPMIDMNNDAFWAGSSSWLLARKEASIDIADPKTKYAACGDIDQEAILVHEMLHVVFAAWDTWSTDREISAFEIDLLIEQPLDQVAYLLVRLRRASGHKFSFEGRF